MNNNGKPDYVLALEAAYGPPSQAAFGSAVFFDHLDNKQEDKDIGELAKKYYRHFIGDKWEEWGEAVWMTPWQEIYVRPLDADHAVVKELRSIDDKGASMSVPMLLEVVENADIAVKALETAYDSPPRRRFPRVYHWRWRGDVRTVIGRKA